jgi:hypothetical protein
VGVAALKWLPYGGLYISGGIAAKNPDWIKSEFFMGAYQDKGRMSDLVMKVHDPPTPLKSTRRPPQSDARHPPQHAHSTSRAVCRPAAHTPQHPRPAAAVPTRARPLRRWRSI